MVDSEIESIVCRLKSTLKAKGITYAALGKKIRMSEAGVKRLLNAKDCSLGRLLQISKAIDVPLRDVIDMPDEEVGRVGFSIAQSEFFEKRTDVFRFFCKLAIEEATLTDIAKEWRLTPAMVNESLMHLQRLGLLKLEAGKKPRILLPSLVRFDDNVACVHRLKVDSANLIVQRLSEGKQDASELFRLSFFKLRESSANELGKALESLIDEFARRSRREQLLYGSQNLVPISMVSAFVQRGFTPPPTDTKRLR
jgi:transcriptional regulator with XRE-family HTH domain